LIFPDLDALVAYLVLQLEALLCIKKAKLVCDIEQIQCPLFLMLCTKWWNNLLQPTPLVQHILPLHFSIYKALCICDQAKMPGLIAADSKPNFAILGDSAYIGQTPGLCWIAIQKNSFIEPNKQANICQVEQSINLS